MNSFLNRIRFLPVAAILIIVASGQTAFSQQLFNLNPLDQGNDQQAGFHQSKRGSRFPRQMREPSMFKQFTTGKHYIYGVDQPEGDGPIPTRVTIKPSGDYKVGDFSAPETT